MKMIIAFIKPERLMDVTLALQELDEISGVSITDIRGFGRDRGRNASESPARVFDFIAKTRIETVCGDDVVERVISIIEQNARTGLRGDGKIFVGPIETAVRISTGERGIAAV